MFDLKISVNGEFSENDLPVVPFGPWVSPKIMEFPVIDSAPGRLHQLPAFCV